jgi:ABC-2 type transport system permease protein
MISLAIKNILRSSGVQIGLALILVLGVVSLFVGKQFTDKNIKDFTETADFQKVSLQRNADNHKDEIGYMLYYAKFSIVNQALPITSLAIGQRDVNATIKSLTIRGLEAQKYDSELNNPFNLLIGNIDFSFVLIYLFPLLIIAFTYNIISEEKESGTWNIVMVQSSNPFLWIVKLFIIRVFLIIGVLLLLLILAVLFLNIPLNQTFFAFVSIALLYIIFWFGLCFWVASLQKSSNFNALVLLSSWIALLIVIPAALNNYLTNKYPVPEALDTTVKQRKGYHEKWDKDKQTTLKSFYKHYPQFKKYTLPSEDFNWLIYYAMQQLGDDEVAVQSGDLHEKLQKREVESLKIAQYFPSLHAQIQLNELANSGLGNQLEFMDETASFHEKLRLYFYPKIFENGASTDVNWAKFKPKIYQEKSNINWLKMLLPLLIISTLCVFWAKLKFSKNMMAR